MTTVAQLLSSILSRLATTFVPMLLHPLSGDFKTQALWEPGPSQLPLPEVESTHGQAPVSVVEHAPASLLPIPEAHLSSSTASAPRDHVAPPVVVPSEGDKLTKASTTFSVTDERERSKDRMELIKVITPLLISGEPLREWVLNLNWVLSGDSWCDMSGTHATDTPATPSLSKDLLTVLTAAATKHLSSAHMRSARSLLEDMIGEADGNNLINRGNGFEMYQLRIKTGFMRGLGTEAIAHLKEHIAALHMSVESIGAFFKRKDHLCAQICLAKGCELGPAARAAFLLNGLQHGACHEVLKLWVNRILLGQGKLKLTSPINDLQQAATDLLATSQFHKGNILQAGKSHSPTSARAAATPLVPIP